MADKEYIERGELSRKMSLQANRSALGEFTTPHLSYGEMLTLVKEAPTADVVKVVRCRHCQFHHWEQEPCHGKTEHFCSVLNAQVFADFYCYHGKPKERES